MLTVSSGWSMGEEDWADIESAPKDGTVIEGRRLHNGREIWRGQCRWRVDFIDDGYQHRQFIGWMLPQDNKIVPKPTHWREAPLTVVFMKWFDPNGRWNKRFVYGPEHVNRARRMVDRNLSIPHRFVLVTDDPSGVDPDIKIVPLRPDLMALGHRWPKLILFAPEARDLFGARLLYLDIDLVIMGDLTPMISHHDFRLLRAVTRRMPYNSSMMLLRTGSRDQVWRDFNPEKADALVQENGISASDRYWIAKSLGATEATWGEDSGVTLYRRKVHSESPLPPATRIVFFPGPVDPSMPDLQNAHPWIVQHWR